MPGKTFVISSADKMMSFCGFSPEAVVEEEDMQVANWANSRIHDYQFYRSDPNGAVGFRIKGKGAEKSNSFTGKARRITSRERGFDSALIHFFRDAGIVDLIGKLIKAHQTRCVS